MSFYEANLNWYKMSLLSVNLFLKYFQILAWNDENEFEIIENTFRFVVLKIFVYLQPCSRCNVVFVMIIHTNVLKGIKLN